MTGWRYRCEHGHVNVHRRTGADQHGRPPEARYYCDTCKAAGRDPHYDRVVDAKTGELTP